MDEFDVKSADVKEINDIYRIDPRSRNRNICICGHSTSRHRFDASLNIHICKPGQLACPCIAMRAVIDVPNTRYFMRKSVGSGAKHALVRGVSASIEALGAEEFEEKRTWLVPAECDICHEPAKYYPVRIALGGTPISDNDPDTGVYAFMCEKCR